jgi:hypothetical protein
MSGYYEMSISYGATHLRIGSSTRVVGMFINLGHSCRIGTTTYGPAGVNGRGLLYIATNTPIGIYDKSTGLPLDYPFTITGNNAATSIVNVSGNSAVGSSGNIIRAMSYSNNTPYQGIPGDAIIPVASNLFSISENIAIRWPIALTGTPPNGNARYSLSVRVSQIQIRINYATLTGGTFIPSGSSTSIIGGVGVVGRLSPRRTYNFWMRPSLVTGVTPEYSPLFSSLQTITHNVSTSPPVGGFENINVDLDLTSTWIPTNNSSSLQSDYSIDVGNSASEVSSFDIYFQDVTGDGAVYSFSLANGGAVISTLVSSQSAPVLF